MARGLQSLPALIAILGIGANPASAVRANASAPEAARPQPRVQLFNIPAQPLIQALGSYSAVTGYQVICESRLSKGRRSNPVVGMFTPETALRMLLDGTPLTIRYSGPQDITLVQSGSDPLLDDPGLGTTEGNAGVMVLDTLHVDVAVGAEKRPDFGDYGMMVRAAVRRALARDRATSHRVFDVQIDIYVGPGGALYEPHLLTSTGVPTLDAAIKRVLNSTVVGKDAPEGLPQPIRIGMVSI